jgi:hypothetical protein
VAGRNEENGQVKEAIMTRILIAAAVLLGTAATVAAQDIPLSKILVEGEGWKIAAKDMRGVNRLSGNPKGISIYGENKAAHLLRPDGKLEEMEVGATVGSNTLYGNYSINREKKGVVANAGEEPILKLDSLLSPNCLVVWPDGAQLVIGDAGDKFLWTARIGKDGSLGGLDRYYSLRVKPGGKASGVTAMVMDAGNLLYACTPLGVQVFDPTGRLCGVVLPPAKEEMTAITIGGEKGDTLFVAAGDKVYSRKIQGKAAYTLKKDK